ncbi:MAG: phosphohydrolase, partial [Bacteroidetes bacterium]|nr:phosphohydrolase [Fibrella sp.]
MRKQLLKKVEAYVVRLFDEHPQPKLTYHALLHTQDVVRAADQLARHYQLSKSDYLTVMTAAWFHDAGYLTGPPKQHEETSLTLATNFLQQADVEPLVIASVARCIRATRMPQSPTNRMEKILCDADLFHLGQDTYKDKQKLLRTECEQLAEMEISGTDWRQQNITLFETHRYFTTYAQTLFMKGQADNLNRLLEKQARKADKDEPVPDSQPPPTPDQPTALPAATINDRKKDKDKD